MFRVRPADVDGTWESNDARYRQYAHRLLAELLEQCRQVMATWPVGCGPQLVDAEATHKDLWELTRLRDRTSDTVRIYAAMSLEGYLNFYGVLRLGQQAYEKAFERLPIVTKLKRLLFTCDALHLSDSHELVARLTFVANSRNGLVHPRAIEVVGDPKLHARSSTPVPGEAVSVVEGMEAFFAAFAVAVPAMSSHLRRDVT